MYLFYNCIKMFIYKVSVSGNSRLHFLNVDKRPRFKFKLNEFLKQKYKI